MAVVYSTVDTIVLLPVSDVHRIVREELSGAAELGLQPVREVGELPRADRVGGLEGRGDLPHLGDDAVHLVGPVRISRRLELAAHRAVVVVGHHVLLNSLRSFSAISNCRSAFATSSSSDLGKRIVSRASWMRQRISCSSNRLASAALETCTTSP